MDEIASYVGSVNYIKKGKNGEDAIFYEIVPSTLVVSIDADGNWVSGTPTMSDGSGMAGVPCTAYMVKNGVKTLFSKGYWLSDHASLGYTSPIFAAQVAKTDSSVNVSLLKSAPTSDGAVSGANVLARISISVNRAGKNGASVSIQYSADGASGWKDAYFAGAKYIRIYSNGAWSSAMKIVGDDGTSFLIKGSFSSKEGLPTSGAAIGDAYLIGGDLWVYVAYAGADTTKHYRGFENIGNIQGPKGDSVTVKSTEVFYGISTSGTDPSTVSSWASSVQDITADKPYLWTKTVVTFSDGKSSIAYSVTTRGNRGAIFRQHTAFEASGYEYQSGSGAEEFIDVIATQTDDGTTRWFRCKKSYNSKDNPTYDDLSKADVWDSSGMQMQFVATDFFLAKNAKINMLGSNEINLYGDDNKMFASFRVPHGKWLDDGDEGEYALWVGAEGGRGAAFSVKKDGAFHATSGDIGGIAFGNGYLGSAADSNMYLTNNRLHFGNWASLNINGGFAFELYGDGRSMYGLDLQSIASDTSITSVGIRSSVTNVYKDNKYCAAALFSAEWSTNAGAIDVSDALSGNHAVIIDCGDVIGLRPSFVRIAKNTTLTEYNYTIECYNTTTITLYLPPEPRIGQHYVIIQREARVDINGSLKNIHDLNSNQDGKSWYSGMKGQVNHLWFNGTEWLVRYYNKG